MEQSKETTSPEDNVPDSALNKESLVNLHSNDKIEIETSSGNTISIPITDPTNCELWIFGYGSLVWRPNFDYNLKLVGSIKGFKRRFWQGNTFHRGSEQNVARVATLIPRPREDISEEELRNIQDPLSDRIHLGEVLGSNEGSPQNPNQNSLAVDPNNNTNSNYNSEKAAKILDEKYTTYGVGFQLKGKEQITGALKHLNVRETKIGGYDIVMTRFHPIMPINKELQCMVFMATTENKLYTGPEDSIILAEKICQASGACGTNVEYLFKLCQWQKSNVPMIRDDHLFNIEAHCLYIIRDKIHEQENISRSLTPNKDMQGTNWLKESWVMSYIELTKMTSGIQCTCHDCPVKDPNEFFGQFGPHYF